MPLSPPLVLEAGSDTKFQLLPLFNIVGPILGLIRNLGRITKVLILILLGRSALETFRSNLPMRKHIKLSHLNIN